MSDKKLVLCYIGASQPSTPPMAIVGYMVEDGDNIKIEGPTSADIAYFSSIGKRLKPLVDAREIHKAKDDKSMRALPQLAPSDFVMMGCTACTEYAKATMSFQRNHVIYTIDLAPESSFAVAYSILMEHIVQDTPLSEFFNESVFDFDSASFLRKLMNPDTVQDVLVPVAVGAGE